MSGLGWTAAFVALLGWAVHRQIAAGLLGAWPVFVLVALVVAIGVEAWLPAGSSRARILGVGATMVTVEALAVLPWVALAWELGGLRIAFAAIVCTVVRFTALLRWAIVKPDLDLQPVDALVVLGVNVASTVIAAVAFRLPAAFVLGSVPALLSSLVALRLFAEVAYTTFDDEVGQAGLRVFLALSWMLVEPVLWFLRAV